MAYIEKDYIAVNHIEREFYFQGKYGSKGEKREKKKHSSLEIKEYNHKQQEKKIRRLIQANFFEHDYYVTLKYKKGTRKDIKGFQKDVGKFLRIMRDRYKRMGVPFKFIYRIEIGSRGGPHVHIIFNRIEGTDTMIKESWKRASEDAGSFQMETLDNENGFERLAAYICKQPDEEVKGQLKFACIEESNKNVFTVSTSRNLVRPEPVKKKYAHWTMKKIIENGPTPTEGFKIDKDSIVTGVNPFNGYTYLWYRESRIKPVSREEYENDLLSKSIRPHKHIVANKA